MLSAPERVILAILLIGCGFYFARTGSRVVRIILKGKRENRFDHPVRRVITLVKNVFFQFRTFRKPIVGLLHFLVVWGFIVFGANTINHFLGGLFDGFTLFFFSHRLDSAYAFLVDLFAILILAGILGLAFRRYVLRPEGLTRPSPESAIVLLFIGSAALAVLLTVASELALGHAHHAEARFASALIAGQMSALSTSSLTFIFHASWWVDSLVHLVLIALLVIPTKHVHLIAGSFNSYFHRRTPRGRLEPLDLEDETAERFGASRIGDFTWKGLLDLASCIECGRCHEHCPAQLTEKPLSPRDLIVDLKHHMLEVGPSLLKNETDAADRPLLPGGVIEEDALWACTTCGACVEQCPMMIEPIDKIVDMRRHLVLTEANFPKEATSVFRNMEIKGDPWGIGANQRPAWTDGLDVPILAVKKTTDVLFWVGCSGSFDERNKRVSIAMVRILKAAGIDFAILGKEEKCNGDSARRMGNEYLFQMLVADNIATLEKYDFKRIVVTCPHCFNTFRNEYPQFGAEFEVTHHSGLIQELIDSNQLNLNPGSSMDIVYHDSCYLGRHNGIYDSPRSVVRAAGHTLTPITNEREEGLCCGAGGGRMWLDEKLGSRINHKRTEELFSSGAGEVWTACPFCLSMVEDGLKDTHRYDAMPVRDLAEIVADAL